jgi:putative acetyltransferase
MTALTMPFAIITLNEPDFPSVMNVWESAVRVSHAFLSENDIALYRQMIIREYLPTLSLFGIHRESGELGGFIGIAHDKIEMLFIHPEEFRRGMGRALCLFAIREHKAAKVDVNEDNPNAVNFYLKMNFTIKGRSDTDPSGNPYPLLHLETQPLP